MTDLSRYDTRQKAEAGVPIPLVIDGETIIGDDKSPITFQTRGVACEEVQSALLKINRSQINTPEDAIEADMRLARAAITGWSDNFKVEGEKYPYSRENIEIVLSNPVVRRSVLEKIKEEGRFMKGS